MTRIKLHHDAGVSRLLERQMRNWELSRAQLSTTDSTERTVADFVTVSRSVGSGGARVAALLGERLGWPVFDRQILEAMAGDDDIRRRIYESMDERDLNWFEKMMYPLTHDKCSRDDYFHKLCQTILSLARQGPGVFLGRAADLILPAEAGLRVRIIASSQWCVQQFAEQHRLDLDEAARKIKDIEQDRSAFIAHHFRVDPNEPARHDLVINLQKFSVKQAVEVVLLARDLKSVDVERGTHEDPRTDNAHRSPPTGRRSAE